MQGCKLSKLYFLPRLGVGRVSTLSGGRPEYFPHLKARTSYSVSPFMLIDAGLQRCGLGKSR